eukprot:TRINITY_DN18010_c0_g1_i4.p1 TRINITY_DN18010_c0_g1~~TRINITY_DN18010_c0_g1_i4.p1  ORF type:complete len:561 (+),score=76.09 TRINITY_DN18010_c0_g1_i4:69-1751(+)
MVRSLVTARFLYSAKMNQRFLALVLGVSLIVPTLLLLLAGTAARWKFSDNCVVPTGEAVALFDYVSFYACAETLPVAVRTCLLIFWLLLLISLLASTADLFFVPQLDALSQDLRLSEDVAGVTLLAFGNGMPDVMTATSAVTKADDFSLMMGEFFGAATFIIVFVLGCVILSDKGVVSVHPNAFVRDAGCYSAVLALMIVATWDGTIYLMEASSGGEKPLCASDVELNIAANSVLNHANDEREMMAFASIDAARYEGSDVVSADASTDAPESQFYALETDDEESRASVGDGDVDVLEGFDTTNADNFFSMVQLVVELPFTFARHASIPSANWDGKRRRLAVICPACGLQVCLLSFGGWEGFEKKIGMVPVWLCLAVLGIVVGGGVLAGSSPAKRPWWHVNLLVFAFACCVGWFNLLATECVSVLETFGLRFGISSSVLGITVLAWGNSVGDLVADTALARQGKSQTAIAGCFGSPLLSDVLGLGVALTSYTLSAGPLRVRLTNQNKVAAFFLAVSIILITCTLVFNRFSFPRRLGYCLVLAYVIYMVWSVAVETSADMQK